jgi:hypothetical protein
MDLSQIKPHRVTKRQMVEAFAPHDPYTGRRYVDPLFISALERQGYDPEPHIAKLLADAEEIDRG